MGDFRVLETVEKQYLREVAKLGEYAMRLELPYSPEELLELSGLSIGAYKVRSGGRTYHYIKLMGVRTGELSDKEETWLVRKPTDYSERERRIRKEAVHIKNLKFTPQNKELVEELHYYWQRAKALRRWLHLVRGSVSG